MLKWALGFMLAGLMGCGHIQTENRNQQAPDKTALQKAHQLLDQGQKEEALKLFQNYSQNNPHSIYFLESRLGEAKAELSLENFKSTFEISREVSLAAGTQKPELTARALYLMSQAYEGLGEELKALASLLDAFRLKDHLPLSVGSAEIPARLAGLYGQMGREKEASSYLSLAESGLAKALKNETPAQAKLWLTKTYFQMGSVTTNQLSSDNFSGFIDGQRWVQVFLIKALKQDDPIWSPQALKQLQLTYQNLLKVVELETDRQKQTVNASQLLEIIEQAHLYKALSEHKIVAYEADFFAFLKEVRARTEKVLYENARGLDLTEAAKERNQLKRMPRAPKKPATLPTEQMGEDVGEDPNL